MCLSGSGQVELGDFQGGDKEYGAVGVVKHVEGCGSNGKEDNSNEEENGPDPCDVEAAVATKAAPIEVVAVVGSGVWTVVVALGVIKLGFCCCWVGCSWFTTGLAGPRLA
ncbi:Uncharacterized protein Fot_18628 [Forsythia ovata]|uniref:Uncharacterized protein n=1 Tax=Forsythia ovata TaxID=205694 RepID=A0ABD1VIQ2_9LAMI